MFEVDVKNVTEEGRGGGEEEGTSSGFICWFTTITFWHIHIDDWPQKWLVWSQN